MSEASRQPPGKFLPETQWSRLVELANRNDPLYADRLTALFTRYWRPIYSYIRAMRRLSREDAEDLTQEFFAMLLDRLDFAALSPDRGSFRTFLKVVLRNFVVSAERKRTAAARRPDALALPFGEVEATWKDSGAVPPEELFDREWSRQLASEAQVRLRDALVAAGKAVYFDIFEAYCLEPTAETYETLAARHGLKPSDVRNYLHFVRQKGREILKDMVAEYLLPGESVEDEVQYLLSL